MLTPAAWFPVALPAGMEDRAVLADGREVTITALVPSGFGQRLLVRDAEGGQVLVAPEQVRGPAATVVDVREHADARVA